MSVKVRFFESRGRNPLFEHVPCARCALSIRIIGYDSSTANAESPKNRYHSYHCEGNITIAVAILTRELGEKGFVVET